MAKKMVGSQDLFLTTVLTLVYAFIATVLFGIIVECKLQASANKWMNYDDGLAKRMTAVVLAEDGKTEINSYVYWIDANASTPIKIEDKCLKYVKPGEYFPNTIGICVAQNQTLVIKQ